MMTNIPQVRRGVLTAPCVRPRRLRPQPLLLLKVLVVQVLMIAAVAAPAPSLEWQNGAGHRSAALSVPASERTGFVSLSPNETGIAFTNVLPQSRHLTNQILLNGSGVAAGDVDGDGWTDLYFAALDRPNALYRNLGNWRFADVTTEAGVACAGLTSSGVALADLDGDGDLDLIVATVGQGTHIFTNDGQGRFREMAVLNGRKGATSLALGDLDGDGFLDLYIANYRTSGLMDMPNTFFNFKYVDRRPVAISHVDRRPVTDPDLANRFRLTAQGGIEENGEADEIFRNAGGKSFAAWPFTGGTFLDEDGRPLTTPLFDWGLSVLVRDLNRDGLPDIYVCNDFDSPDRIWLNQGGGRFRAAPRLAFRKGSHFAMGVDVADINRDGHDDIFVVDMLSREHGLRMDMMNNRTVPDPVADWRPDYMMNTLFLNRGDGTYAEMAQLAGVNATEWSWAVAFLDVDLDGFEDLLVANGHERQGRSLDIAERLRHRRVVEGMTNAADIFESRKMYPRQDAENLAFRNRGDLTFQDMSHSWGFHYRGVSHGLCLADLDNDGDLDVVVNNLNDGASVHRNVGAAPRLAIRLKGQAPNTRGIGARIEVRGAAVPQSQEMVAGGRYLSSDDPMRAFAARATNELTVDVIWRSGRRSRIRNAVANRLYEVDEASAEKATSNPGANAAEANRPKPFFEDVSARLNHLHRDDPFDDFARQPGLPNRLSQCGPGVTWADLDGDGWEELLIPGGRGGSLAVLHPDGKGAFSRQEGLFASTADRDQTAVLPWRQPGAAPVLLVGQASDELPADGPCLRAWPLRGAPLPPDAFPAMGASAGPLAMADVNGDGRPELFVGGRFVPGRWPEPAPSALFRGGAAGFTLDEENTRRLTPGGLVCGATFTDLDGDGDPDLVLACEWGPLRFFNNDRGKLIALVPTVRTDSPTAAASGNVPLTGWWTGVASGDFNNDGRVDLVVGNWGRNTPFEAHRASPLEMVYGDLNGDGSVEVIESWLDPAAGRRWPERQRDFLARGLPFLNERYATHVAFGQASIEEMLGDHVRSARRLTALWLESIVLLNMGTGFVARPLPVEAQMAPAFGVCVADFDADGNEDIFLSQNFFAVQPETPRYDAGLGLWMRGDGRGGFTAVSARDSGLRLPGQQRGAAVCDFDHDGRLDLAVAQNGAETKLYRNTSARPGLRVRLLGPPENPDAIGAAIRPLSGPRSGALREIHAGSGWWSQDAPVQVFANSPAVSALAIRWPGAKAWTTNQVPAGAMEVTVDTSGSVKTTR